MLLDEPRLRIRLKEIGENDNLAEIITLLIIESYYISMKLNFEALRIKTIKLIFVIVAWILAAFYFISVENLNVSHFIEVNNLKISVSYEYVRQVSTHLLAALIGGLVLGGFEIFYFRNHFRKRSFGFVIVVKSLFYSCSLIFCINGYFPMKYFQL